MTLKKPATKKTAPKKTATKLKAKKPLAKPKPGIKKPTTKTTETTAKKPPVESKEKVQEAVAAVSKEPNVVTDGTITIQEALEAARRPNPKPNYPWLK